MRFWYGNFLLTFLMTQWLHTWNFKSFRIMSATDILWPPPTTTSRRLLHLQDKLHQFYVFLSSSKHLGTSRIGLHGLLSIFCTHPRRVAWNFYSLRFRVSHSLSQYHSIHIVFIIAQCSNVLVVVSSKTNTFHLHETPFHSIHICFSVELYCEILCAVKDIWDIV